MSIKIIFDAVWKRLGTYVKKHSDKNNEKKILW